MNAGDYHNRFYRHYHKCVYTALQIASFWGNLSVVECLLDHEADVNAVRGILGTALQATLGASF
jgi:hypothetical protein